MQCFRTVFSFCVFTICASSVYAASVCSQGAKVVDPFRLFETYDQSPFIKGPSKFPERQFFTTQTASLGGGRFYSCAVLLGPEAANALNSVTDGDTDNLHRSLGKLVGTKTVGDKMSRSVVSFLSFSRNSEAETVGIAIVKGAGGLAVGAIGGSLFGGVFLLVEVAAVIGEAVLVSEIKKTKRNKAVPKAVIKELFSKTGGHVERRLRVVERGGNRYLNEVALLRVTINGVTYRYVLFEVAYMLVAT